MSTTYDRRAWVDDPGERLRAEKLRGPKGIGLLTACIAIFIGLIMPVTFWMASQIAPEPEESRHRLSVEQELSRAGTSHRR
jgi:hypothetical protein